MQKGLRVFVRDEAPLASIAERLRAKGEGEVSLIVMLGAQEGEVEVRLPGRYAVTGAVAGALKAVTGVVAVEHVREPFSHVLRGEGGARSETDGRAGPCQSISRLADPKLGGRDPSRAHDEGFTLRSASSATRFSAQASYSTSSGPTVSQIASARRSNESASPRRPERPSKPARLFKSRAASG